MKWKYADIRWKLDFLYKKNMGNHGGYRIERVIIGKII